MRKSPHWPPTPSRPGSVMLRRPRFARRRRSSPERSGKPTPPSPLITSGKEAALRRVPRRPLCCWCSSRRERRWWPLPPPLVTVASSFYAAATSTRSRSITATSRAPIRWRRKHNRTASTTPCRLPTFRDPLDQAAFAHRNLLSAALDGSEPADARYYAFRLVAGDRLLIDSDGVHDNLNRHELAEIAAAPDDAQHTAEAVTDAAWRTSQHDPQRDPQGQSRTTSASSWWTSQSPELGAAGPRA